MISPFLRLSNHKLTMGFVSCKEASFPFLSTMQESSTLFSAVSCVKDLWLK